MVRLSASKDELQGSLVPQFLQNSASGGLDDAQEAHVFGTGGGPRGAVLEARCVNIAPAPPRNPQIGTLKVRNRTRFAGCRDATLIAVVIA